MMPWYGQCAGKEGKAVGFAILEILEGKNLEPKDKSGDLHSLGHSSDLASCEYVATCA